jgi:phosphoglycerate dehydrogenase-like enzyme
VTTPSDLDLLFCGTGWLPMIGEIRARLPVGARIRGRDLSRTLEEDTRGAHVLLPSNTRIGAEVMAASASLRLIQQPAVGVEGIDLVAARARGIPVCNAPGSNSAALAEAALLLILALARKLPEAQRVFREPRIGVPLGVELEGKRLGVVGMGRSGTRLAQAAQALGMEVEGLTSRSGRPALHSLLEWADVISLHCPLTPETRGLLGPTEFARMKPGAFLINCARGGMIDRPAFEAALESGRLGGAGLDVFWEEPWDPTDPLFRRENVVTLPHIGGSTVEVFSRVADLVVENIRRLLEGQPLLHQVA